MFSCFFCHSILYKPATLICGHTFCKSCFLKNKARKCKRCNEPQDNKFPVKINVLLCRQLEKYFSSDYHKPTKSKNEDNFKDYNPTTGSTKGTNLYPEAVFASLHQLFARNGSFVLSAQKWLMKDGDCQPQKPMTSKIQAVASETASRYDEITKDTTDDDKVKERKRRHSDPIINSVYMTASEGDKKSCTGEKVIPQNLLNHSDYDCSLCFRLLHKPMTTPCGHTFCMGCLNRCMDHNPQCPLCKDSLIEYLANKKRSVNILIDNILNRYFEKDVKERNEIHAKEMEELRGAAHNQNESIIVPIFNCTISFPTIPCLLYIFEPRYKLMIRQCMESGSRQFGMCVPSEQNVFSDYGCMLEIQELEVMANGRLSIRTVGVRRFKVLSRGTRDGYSTAEVMFIEDETLEENEVDCIKSLHQSVYEEALTWYNNLGSACRLKISQNYSSIPALPDNLLDFLDGPRWTWWLLAVLPIPEQDQLQCIAMTNIKERFLFFERWLRTISE